MNKKQTNQVLQFLLALALPLVAIGAGLQSCSDDGPGIPHADDAEEVAQVRNLLMRSPEEAIDIAQRAWEDFYGDESSTASRSGRRCVIDYGRPVEVIRGAKSRGGSGQDTLQNIVSGPYVDELWGQGNGLPVNLNSYPEGYLFENGWAGCSTAAIAMACAHYSVPEQINVSPLVGSTTYNLDWPVMKRHRSRVYGGPNGFCKDTDAAHSLIANFYKIITVWTDATPHGETGTSTKTVNVLPVLRNFLPQKTIDGWKDLKFEVGPAANELYVMEGKSTLSGHMWLCDGFKHQIIVHYFATRPNSSVEWEIQTQERRIQQFLHYNWGWYGRYDGWYNNATSVGIHKDNGVFSTYKELKYARIS